MQRYDHNLKEPGSLREVEWGPFVLWSDHQSELQRVQSDHEQAVAKAREALSSAESALTHCYDVLEYPGNGQSPQDNALAEVREALAALTPTDSGK